ncbi:MAG: FHA domain-containing protein [Prevotellaceae bacterium]|jgi:pSer/pThr/pTyr-binding forkhead associated (FHA) protein|nr:FHA domain-containing protein [Prevotellaceae bacterium]
MKIITVGRGMENTVIVNDPYVSRKHLKLEQDSSGSVQITDLDSTGGTFVNGKKLTGGEGVYLSPTDIVRIGNTTLPWKSYFVSAETTVVGPDSKRDKRKKRRERKERREKKPVNFRNVLSIVMTVFSLMFMIMMFLRMLKII